MDTRPTPALHTTWSKDKAAAIRESIKQARHSSRRKVLNKVLFRRNKEHEFNFLPPSEPLLFSQLHTAVTPLRRTITPSCVLPVPRPPVQSLTTGFQSIQAHTPMSLLLIACYQKGLNTTLSKIEMTESRPLFGTRQSFYDKTTPSGKQQEARERNAAISGYLCQFESSSRSLYTAYREKNTAIKRRQ